MRQAGRPEKLRNCNLHSHAGPGRGSAGKNATSRAPGYRQHGSVEPLPSKDPAGHGGRR